MLTVNGSTTWSPEVLFRPYSVTKTGYAEWMLTFAAWPDWKLRYVVTDNEYTAKMLDAALWRLAQEEEADYVKAKAR